MRTLGNVRSGRLAATKRVHSDRNPARAEGRAEFFESAGDGAAAVRAMTVFSEAIFRKWGIQLNAVPSLSMGAKARKYPAKQALCCAAWPTPRTLAPQLWAWDWLQAHGRT